MARASARFDPDARITNSNPAKVAVDREQDMIGLKRQMNALARELGRTEPFNLTCADAPPAPPVPTSAANDSRPPATHTKEAQP